MSGTESAEMKPPRTVKDLVAGSGFSFMDRGERELKGVPDLWRLLHRRTHADCLTDCHAVGSCSRPVAGDTRIRVSQFAYGERVERESDCPDDFGAVRYGDGRGPCETLECDDARPERDLLWESRAPDPGRIREELPFWDRFQVSGDRPERAGQDRLPAQPLLHGLGKSRGPTQPRRNGAAHE